MNNYHDQKPAHGQRGYTLIEIILGLALTGILAIGISIFATHSIKVSGTSKDRMHALMQVENAGYWLSRDIQMSENFTLGDSAGFPLQLMWSDTDQNEYLATYSITDDEINRSLVKNEEVPIRTLIAQSVNDGASLTSVNVTEGVFLLKITCTSGKIDVTRSYTIKPRLDLDN